MLYQKIVLTTNAPRWILLLIQPPFCLLKFSLRTNGLSLLKKQVFNFIFP
jgi:hypothetical protein